MLWRGGCKLLILRGRKLNFSVNRVRGWLQVAAGDDDSGRTCPGRMKNNRAAILTRIAG